MSLRPLPEVLSILAPPPRADHDNAEFLTLSQVAPSEPALNMCFAFALTLSLLKTHQAPQALLKGILLNTPPDQNQFRLIAFSRRIFSLINIVHVAHALYQ